LSNTPLKGVGLHAEPIAGGEVAGAPQGRVRQRSVWP
jgi:hypothetical protein